MTDAAGPQGEGEAQCLVSEFPNPPPYYKLFSGSLPADQLPPPPSIPTAKLEATAAKVAEITAAVQTIRDELADTLVGVDPSSAVAAAAHAAIAAASAPPNLDEVVSIFGEVVEDPLLRITDEKADKCDDPSDVAREMKQINNEIMKSFVTLTNVLLQAPAVARSELVKVSKLLVRLLEQSNRYREHQARENLIAVLEETAEAKRAALAEVERELEATEAALEEVVKLKG